VDVGGTFTDLLLHDTESGQLWLAKVPSTPQDQSLGVLDGIRTIAGIAGVAAGDLDTILHGTTVATNAVLEKRGARVGLLTSEGFRWILHLAEAWTPGPLFGWMIYEKPEPIAAVEDTRALTERVGADGSVLCDRDEAGARVAIAELRDRGVEAMTVSLVNAFANPAHERTVARLVREEAPALPVSISSEVLPEFREYERTVTTVVNAYVSPVLDRYLSNLRDRLQGEGTRAELRVVRSDGGLMSLDSARATPVHTVLSGPAGGVQGAAYVAARAGLDRILTFDMGGTSTDVGMIVDGQSLGRVETEIGKYHLLLPMVDVSAIGAGGGSIARVEAGGYLRIGPESAGAVPGPACYAAGGELPTVTDADLLLGILDPDAFLGGRMTLDVDAAREAVRRHVADPLGISVPEAAAGIKRIVDGRMGDLLRTVTLERGHDPREFTLYAYGGAGPSHAPAFALELVDAVLVPVTQSVHSALGAASSDIALRTELSSPMRVARESLGADVDAGELESIFSDLERSAREQLEAQGVAPERQSLARVVEVRFIRQTKALEVLYTGSPETLIEDFLRIYAQRYGETAVPELAGFELVTFVVLARGTLRRPALRRSAPRSGAGASALGERSVYDPLLGEFVPTPIYRGEDLQAGDGVDGPAVIQYATTTLAVCSGQRAEVGELLEVEIRRQA
jgi:N-methylhydantoinase A